MKIEQVALNLIDQNENSRVIYKASDLSELMHSMKKNGLLQPVGLSKRPNGRYEAVFGNRRIMGAKKLGWADITAHIVDAENDNDRDILNLLENLKRANTTVAEDGRIFQALRDRGLTNEEIATRLDVNVHRVELGLEVFNEVPKELHKQIVNRVTGAKQKGTVSATTAHAIMSMRKTYKLNRKQMRSLFNFAREDGVSTTHMQHVAPLLKEGFSVGEAIKAVDKMARVVMYIYVDERRIKKLETEHGKSISSLLWEQLEKNKELGVKRLAAGDKLKSFDNKLRKHYANGSKEKQ